MNKSNSNSPEFQYLFSNEKMNETFFFLILIHRMKMEKIDVSPTILKSFLAYNVESKS